MKQHRLIILIIATIIFLLFIYIGKGIIEKRSLYEKELDMHLTVSNYTGFNIDTDAIYFGTVSPGGISKRIVTVHNFDFRSDILIKKSGNLAKWVRLDEERFIMNVNEERNISVSVIVPVNAEYGNYSGKLKLAFRRA